VIPRQCVVFFLFNSIFISFDSESFCSAKVCFLFGFCFILAIIISDLNSGFAFILSFSVLKKVSGLEPHSTLLDWRGEDIVRV
jgi:hypothetical protein